MSGVELTDVEKKNILDNLLARGRNGWEIDRKEASDQITAVDHQRFLSRNFDRKSVPKTKEEETFRTRCAMANFLICGDLRAVQGMFNDPESVGVSVAKTGTQTTNPALV